MTSLKESEPNIRVVVVFPGYRNQYIEKQIEQYKENGISDIIYEGKYLDEECFVDVIRKGYIYDYDVNVFDDSEEKDKTNAKIKKCLTIGVMGITHGVGVTNMVVSISNYIALSENIQVKAVDYSGTGSLRFADGKKVAYIVNSDIDIDKLKKNNKAIVFDFGTPFNISSKGKLLNEIKDEKLTQLFQDCDLKILMCYADIWHIGKVKYFINDKRWKKKLDDSYIFLFDVVDERFKIKYKKLNIYNRNDDATRKRIAHL